MSMVSFGGGRENGGVVDASKYYRVGENGKPEIFQASSGKQYMIPGDNGRVISNKDMQGGRGGGVNFKVVIENHVSNAAIETRMEKGLTNEDVARIVITDLREKGPIHRAVTDTTTAGPRL